MTNAEFGTAMIRFHRMRMAHAEQWGPYEAGKPNFMRDGATRAYAPRFERIDHDVFETEFSLWLDASKEFRPSIDTLFSRCRVAQDEVNAAKPRPRPKLPTPEERAEYRVGVRACRIRLVNSSMTYDAALAQAREEVGDDNAP